MKWIKKELKLHHKLIFLYEIIEDLKKFSPLIESKSASKLPE